MEKDTRSNEIQICVVIPAFKVKPQILKVIESIGPEVQKIIVVDDACPDRSGDHVKANTFDSRVEVIYHSKNLGVGGAVKTGYRRALELSSNIEFRLECDWSLTARRFTILNYCWVLGSY
jgi:glycosyltransferase involved in cell wall biosynthesis